MPAAIVGLALVGGSVVTAATLGYIGLGLSVAGMVTKNKTLLKIGGQLGLAAGVAGLATSFMGGGAASLSNVAGTASGVAGNLPSGDLPTTPAVEPTADPTRVYDDKAFNILNDNSGEIGVQQQAPGAETANEQGLMPQTVINNNETVKQPELGGLGTQQGVTEQPGSTLGKVGGTQGTGLGTQGVKTANDAASATPKPDAGFFDRVFGNGTMTNSDKYAMVEGGKIIAGGIQGLSQTSAANTQLDERRRIADLQRANAAQAGRLNYGLMSRPA
jgi:hypothetical protein